MNDEMTYRRVGGIEVVRALGRGNTRDGYEAVRTSPGRLLMMLVIRARETSTRRRSDRRALIPRDRRRGNPARRSGELMRRSVAWRRNRHGRNRAGTSRRYDARDRRTRIILRHPLRLLCGCGPLQKLDQLESFIQSRCDTAAGQSIAVEMESRMAL